MSEPGAAASSLTPPGPVAFIGLGKMGQPMAARLLAAGYRVQGFDLSPAARERFAAAGGMACTDAAAALAGATAVITMLPHGKAVQAALLDPAGKPLGLAAGSTVIDMSSSAPLDTIALGEALAAAGIALIDAPVSGGVKRALDGSLAIMAGGEAAVIARCRPLLLAMGGSVFPTGKLGSGHAMKALNNYVSAAGLVAAAEALLIGRRFGLDPATMVEVLNNSTGRNNSTEHKVTQFILSENYGSGFALGLMAKDLTTADDLRRHLGLDLPLSALCRELWQQADAALGAGADHTEIYRFLARGADDGAQKN